MPVDPAQVAYPDHGYPDEFYPETVPMLTTPKRQRPLTSLTSDPATRMWSRVRVEDGVTVIKVAEGVYQQVVNPTDEQLASAEAVYLGGRNYEVTIAEADALEAAGYEVSPT